MKYLDFIIVYLLTIAALGITAIVIFLIRQLVEAW